MIAQNIIDYYLENSQPTLNLSLSASANLPVIESWICCDIGDEVVISGQIYNHPKYLSGKSIKSSPIQGYLTKGDCVYVTTKNSMYELGTPHPDFADHTQRLIGNSENNQSAKVTYWGLMNI